MTEHWFRSQVIGQGPDGGTVSETLLHKEGQDVIGMAMRRNPQLAGCGKVEIRTLKAFTRERAEEPRRTQAEIPRDDRQGEEFEW